ncbi:DUF1345 domain-containing protein [Sphingomonas parva]|uniref:DUF1345 domain-containing protein n=1 Tax=Sphingomonas parva TaxID=2555898 RepID=A0A4Y8ZRA1_9SPHN|nr:DUF1345 domain-containing protein [Sphingomonas parva]TFI58558.1 DUF1345 domain-containing protein [Sphingomonas parva]
MPGIRKRNRPNGLPHSRFLAFLLAFVAASGLAALAAPAWSAALMTGFDLAALLFLLLAVLLMRGADPGGIERAAARNAAGKGLLLAISAAVLAAVLAAVATELGRVETGGDAAMPLVTLALSWIFGNTVYALEYAHIYYERRDGALRHGLAFPGDQPPDYLDFVYFAYTVGIAGQVSDVAATDRGIRRILTGQALVSYAFNIFVLAITVNAAAAML